MKQRPVTPLILLAILLVVFLAACGGNQTPTPTPDPTPEVDTQAPTVRITSSAISATDEYVLEGIIVDNDGIDAASYSLNEGEFQELGVTDDAFSVTVMLLPGVNSISVSATDKAGNTGEDSVSVTYGAPPAGVTISSDIVAAGSPLTISGSNLGEGGSVSLGGMTVTPDTWTDTEITLTVPADAPGGPQELTVTTSAGSETFELFVGVDFPEGTLEELADLKLPKGTAVRLGEGTFESTSGTLALDNLSFYGQGETRTTLKATGSSADPRLLYLYADTEFDLVMTGVTLEVDRTTLISTPMETPEGLGVSSAGSFEAFSSMAVDPHSLMSSFRAETSGSFTTASYGTDSGSYELRNVTITGGPGDGGFITTGLMTGTNYAYLGRLTFDNVSFDNDENFLYLVGSGSIEIRDSHLNLGEYFIGSAGGKIIIDESELIGNAPRGYAFIISMRGLELTGSAFMIMDGGLEFLAGDESGGLPLPSASIIRDNEITALDSSHPLSGDPGMIRMFFEPTTALVEKNIFTAERAVYFESYGGGLTIDDNDFTIGHALLDNSNSLRLDAGFSSSVAFNNNKVDFLATGGIRAVGGMRASGNHSFFVNDNIINGFNETGTALFLQQDSPYDPLSITAQRNTFTDFSRALQLDRVANSPSDEVFAARINHNVFDFPINGPGQAAYLWGMSEAEVDLDATNNVWGDNTTVADVESHINREGGSDGILKIDPIKLP